MNEFAPVSIVFKLLEYLLKNDKFTFTPGNLDLCKKILLLTFKLFEVYKENSKYFIIKINSSSKLIEEKEVRRMSALFTDILELLVQFSCIFLKNLANIGLKEEYQDLSLSLYLSLLADKSSEDPQFVQCFTLKERLKILYELNSVLN